MLELCRVVRAYPGTTLEIVPPPGRFSDAHVELMTSMSLAADRPLNWNLINVATAIADDIGQRLGASDAAAAAGACVIGLVLPGTSAMRLNFTSGFLIDALPVFGQLFELPVAERLRVLASPEARALLRRAEHTPEGAALYYLVDWGGLTIGETVAPSNAGLAGRTIAEVAAARGVDPFDALCDVVVADELGTVLLTPVRGDDAPSWTLRQRVVRDARTIPGGSDSGAHLDMLDTFTMATRLLGEVVRDRGLFTLAEAVQLMTAAPAGLYGIRGRGHLTAGAHADLFVFDPDRIGSGPVHTRRDLPAGASRLYADATGVHSVVVNGTEVVHGSELTGALPGTVLRSGRDTTTVTAAEALRGDWRRSAHPAAR
jgi:N-acyl-D-aspartate/D-glutamate deacylase